MWPFNKKPKVVQPIAVEIKKEPISPLKFLEKKIKDYEKAKRS